MRGENLNGCYGPISFEKAISFVGRKILVLYVRDKGGPLRDLTPISEGLAIVIGKESSPSQS